MRVARRVGHAWRRTLLSIESERQVHRLCL